MTTHQPEPVSTPEPVAELVLPQHELTAQEMFDDLSGFDEIAIARRFGTPVNELGKSPIQFARALVFIDLRRKGSTDGEAYKAAQDMKVGQIKHYFKPDPQPTEDAPRDGSDEDPAGND